MKIAFYVEDGREQIVLTPQTDVEKAMLAKLHDGQRISTIYRGSFYECRSGWTRYEPRWVGDAFRTSGSDESTIIVLSTKPEGEE